MNRRTFARNAAASLLGAGIGATAQSSSGADPSETDPTADAPAVQVDAEVSSIAELKDVSPADATVVRCLGYHQEGDRGGGVFRWVPDGNPAEADEGLVVASTVATSGVWRRQVTEGLLPVTFWGARGNGQTEERAAIQRGLNAHHAVYFPPGTYLINGSEGQESGGYGGIFPQSNQTLVFAEGAKLKILPDDGYYSGINLRRVENVRLISPEVEGERTQRTEEACRDRAKCEFGHCINIQGSVSNVYVENPVCYNGWGDGLRINCPDGQLNLTVVGGELRNNRRNGISVISARGATFHGTRVLSNGGTSPHKGVDVEPNGPEYPVQDVRFVDCWSSGHRGAGFSVAFGLTEEGLNEDASVHFQGCISTDDNKGFFHEVAEDVPGVVTMSNCVVRRPKTNGLCVSNWDTSLTVNGLTVHHPNRDGESDPWRGAGVLVEVSRDQTTTGNVTITNYVCIDDGSGSAIDIRRFGGRAGARLENIVVEGRNRGATPYTSLSDIDAGMARVEFDAWSNRGRKAGRTDENGDLRIEHGLPMAPTFVQTTVHGNDLSAGTAVVHPLESEEGGEESFRVRIRDRDGRLARNADVTVAWEARFQPY